ncbi:regulatory protein recx [Lucifera butyrica]|uniref:Regulatory protein RecX n=1 Tax=Lucifera butyrica TaxID=1351585 RepID=A0A498R5A4_9FIRM|nr:regulatory protein recx [Lucifera butyrica]
MPLNEQDVFQLALTMLSRRSCSEAEVALQLKRKNVDGATVMAVISRLREYGYLNDAALCDLLLHKYSTSKKYGIRAIVDKLKRRGLPGPVIQNVINSFDYAGELKKAQNLIQKYITAKPVSNYEIQTKVARFLYTKGFSQHTINAILEELPSAGQE